ncbi:hypothetical protein WUBG_07063, partial [Wuchereria bancrofti]
MPEYNIAPVKLNACLLCILPAGALIVESGELMYKSGTFARCSSYFVENKLGCHAVAGVNQTPSEKHRISVTS